jgi:hypothetical protein
LKGIAFLLIAVAAVAGFVAFTTPASGRADGEAAPISGITIPPGYRDWRLISVAHEAGNNNDIRAVLGNDNAIKAYRESKLPFPDGTMIARLAGDTSRLKKTTKSLAVSSLLLPAPLLTFSTWSRIQQNGPQRVAGVSFNSIRTANPTSPRQLSKPASPATSRAKLGTLSSPITHLERRSRRYNERSSRGSRAEV